MNAIKINKRNWGRNRPGHEQRSVTTYCCKNKLSLSNQLKGLKNLAQLRFWQHRFTNVENIVKF